jgi:hypothetical protein
MLKFGLNSVRPEFQVELSENQNDTYFIDSQENKNNKKHARLFEDGC